MAPKAWLFFYYKVAQLAEQITDENPEQFFHESHFYSRSDLPSVLFKLFAFRNETTLLSLGAKFPTKL